MTQLVVLRKQKQIATYWGFDKWEAFKEFPLNFLEHMNHTALHMCNMLQEKYFSLFSILAMEEDFLLNRATLEFLAYFNITKSYKNSELI